MSELSLGGTGDLGDWGYPSGLYNYATGQYDDDGMIWNGKNKATKADRKQCKKAVHHKPCKLDSASVCGTNDPDWSTFREDHKGEVPYTQHVTVG
jgi:hypothetical protein